MPTGIDDYWNPQTVDQQRRYGQGLMQAGTDISPVGHWTQALARGLQGGIGGYVTGQANRAETAGNNAVSDTYRSALSGGVTPRALAAQLMDPARTGGFGAEEGRGIAKAVIANDIKGPEQTEAQRNYAYGLKNPGFAAREIQLKTAGRPQTTVDMRGETETSKAVGKGAGEAVVKLYDQARGAAGDMRQLGMLQAQLERIKSGPTAPAVRTAAAWARDLGVSADTLEAFGIPKNFVGDSNAFESATSGMLVNKLGSGGFPSNNFSNADREFLEKTLPRLSTDPRGNRIMIEVARRAAEANIDKARQYQAWKALPANEKKSFYDFDMDYSQRVSNRFDDIVEKSRQLLDSAGQGYAPPPQTPGAPPPPQQQAAPAQIIQNGMKMIQSGQIDPASVIESAKRSIAGGADPAQVMQRLQELGIPTDGLMPQAAPQPPRRGSMGRETLRNG